MTVLYDPKDTLAVEFRDLENNSWFVLESKYRQKETLTDYDIYMKIFSKFENIKAVTLNSCEVYIKDTELVIPIIITEVMWREK